VLHALRINTADVADVSSMSQVLWVGVTDWRTVKQEKLTMTDYKKNKMTEDQVRAPQTSCAHAREGAA
jgi:hypothetical protein